MGEPHERRRATLHLQGSVVRGPRGARRAAARSLAARKARRRQLGGGAAPDRDRQSVGRTATSSARRPRAWRRARRSSCAWPPRAIAKARACRPARSCTWTRTWSSCRSPRASAPCPTTKTRRARSTSWCAPSSDAKKRRSASSIGSTKRPRGSVLFARNLAAKLDLKNQFRVHSVRRRYRAIVHGAIDDRTIYSRLVQDRGDGRRGSTNNPTLGRESTTHVFFREALEGRDVHRVSAGDRTHASDPHSLVRSRASAGGRARVRQEQSAPDHRRAALDAARACSSASVTQSRTPSSTSSSRCRTTFWKCSRAYAADVNARTGRDCGWSKARRGSRRRSLPPSSCRVWPGSSSCSKRTRWRANSGMRSLSKIGTRIESNSVMLGRRAPVPKAAQALSARHSRRFELLRAHLAKSRPVRKSVTSSPCDFVARRGRGRLVASHAERTAERSVCLAGHADAANL